MSNPLTTQCLDALHRDGSVSAPLKGNLWKGPFHLPRALWYCWRLCEEMTAQRLIRPDA